MNLWKLAWRVLRGLSAERHAGCRSRPALRCYRYEQRARQDTRAGNYTEGATDERREADRRLGEVAALAFPDGPRLGNASAKQIGSLTRTR
jgi:hypothetical protein